MLSSKIKFLEQVLRLSLMVKYLGYAVMLMLRLMFNCKDYG
jgi:hypothetical protein